MEVRQLKVPENSVPVLILIMLCIIIHRLVADVLNDVGIMLDLLAPLFPGIFLLIACVASLSRVCKYITIILDGCNNLNILFFHDRPSLVWLGVPLELHLSNIKLGETTWLMSLLKMEVRFDLWTNHHNSVEQGFVYSPYRRHWSTF